MSDDQASPIQDDAVHDELYWSALFETEESVAEDESSNADEFPGPLTATPAIQKPTSGETDPPLARRESPDPKTDPWALARACVESDQVLTLTVVGHNKGGLLIDWNGIQGFVPASQLIDFPQFHVPRERDHSLAEWHERRLNLKIIELDQAGNRLIFSERATLVAAAQRDGLLQKVVAGERREGIITNLTKFGAFVDLGGVEGLVHISEISWSRVVHPSDLLRPGQSVQVIVLNVDPVVARIALSLKRLRPDPWQTAQERYHPGQLVRGVIGNITPYGAFVVLEEELEGLIHHSELAEGVFMHTRDVVQPGEEVIARVLSVDSPKKRIALSLRGVVDASTQGT